MITTNQEFKFLGSQRNRFIFFNGRGPESNFEINPLPNNEQQEKQKKVLRIDTSKITIRDAVVGLMERENLPEDTKIRINHFDVKGNLKGLIGTTETELDEGNYETQITLTYDFNNQPIISIMQETISKQFKKLKRQANELLADNPQKGIQEKLFFEKWINQLDDNSLKYEHNTKVNLLIQEIQNEEYPTSEEAKLANELIRKLEESKIEK